MQEAVETLAQLRLALDFALARQALIRQQLTQLQQQANSCHQQEQLARRAERQCLTQRLERQTLDCRDRQQALQADWDAQNYQVESLRQRIQSLRDSMDQAQGFGAGGGDRLSLRRALMPAAIAARFTGQLEL